MTRPQNDRHNCPFSAWVSENDGLDSKNCATNVSDVDWLFHRYVINTDGVGTREIQCMMLVETKTYNTEPRWAQKILLWYQHNLLKTEGSYKEAKTPEGAKIAIRHYGVSFLKMSGERPDDGGEIRWGRFDSAGMVRYTMPINPDFLTKLLHFDVSPQDLRPIDLRRHHSTSELLIRHRVPLGFETDYILKKRS